MSRGDTNPNSDAKIVIMLFKRAIFPRFDIPRAIIRDGGSHFIEWQSEHLLKKYGVTHKVAYRNFVSHLFKSFF